jgi:threonyl-tRNA synthetase
MKVPFILAVGGREAESRTVALRRLGSNEQQVIDSEEALAMLRTESLAPDMAH